MTGLQIFNLILAIVVIGMYILNFILKKKQKGDIRKPKAENKTVSGDKK